MKGASIIALMTATGLIFGMSASAQTEDTKRPAPSRAQVPADNVKAPETPEENAAVFIKIKGVDGESENQAAADEKSVKAPDRPQENAAIYVKIGDIKGESSAAMTGDANLDGQVDMDDLNNQGAANPDKLAAPKPGPQKTSFGVLLGSGGGDAPTEPEKPSESDDD